jgi:hypothetical protein
LLQEGIGFFPFFSCVLTNVDFIQTLLLIVVVSLSLLLIIVGVQVVLILFGLRKALKRINSILDDSILGGGLIRPDKLTGILEMFRKKKKVEKIGEGDVS